jgi:epsin
MDLASLKEAAANLSLYDIKAGVRKVQNGKITQSRPVRTLTDGFAAVMNYTEMEAKVREATNNEPWGASSTYVIQSNFIVTTIQVLAIRALACGSKHISDF